MNENLKKWLHPVTKHQIKKFPFYGLVKRYHYAYSEEKPTEAIKHYQKRCLAGMPKDISQKLKNGMSKALAQEIMDYARQRKPESQFPDILTLERKRNEMENALGRELQSTPDSPLQQSIIKHRIARGCLS